MDNKKATPPTPGSVPVAGKIGPGKSSSVSGAPSAGQASKTVPNPKSEDLVIPPWVNRSNTDLSRSGIIRDAGLVNKNYKGNRSYTRSTTVQRQSGKRNYENNRKAPLGLIALGLVAILLFIVAPDLLNSIFKIATPVTIGKSEGENKLPLSAGSRVEQPGREVSSDGKGKIIFETNVKDFSVSINHRPVAVSDNSVRALADIDLNVEIAKEGYDSKTYTVKLSPDKAYVLSFNLEKIEEGTLTFLTNPGADITLKPKNGGKSISLYTPLRDYRLRVGEYEAIIENSSINHRSKIEFKIDKGRATLIEKDL